MNRGKKGPGNKFRSVRVVFSSLQIAKHRGREKESQLISVYGKDDDRGYEKKNHKRIFFIHHLNLNFIYRVEKKGKKPILTHTHTSENTRDTHIVLERLYGMKLRKSRE